MLRLLLLGRVRGVIWEAQMAVHREALGVVLALVEQEGSDAIVRLPGRAYISRWVSCNEGTWQGPGRVRAHAVGHFDMHCSNRRETGNNVIARTCVVGRGQKVPWWKRWRLMPCIWVMGGLHTAPERPLRIGLGRKQWVMRHQLSKNT